VSVLNVDVAAVRLGDIVGLRSAQVVAVHVNRHLISLARRGLILVRPDRNLGRTRS
jgi:hypothetical protein